MAGMNAALDARGRDGVPGLFARNALHRCEFRPPDRRHGRRRYRLRAGLGGRRLEKEVFRMTLNRRLVVVAALARSPSAPACLTPSAPAADPLEQRRARSISRMGASPSCCRPDLAPKHVARVKQLVREHFYDSIVFIRVIPGFMAQTRRSDGHRHRRLEISRPSGRVQQQGDIRARHHRRGAVERSQ